MNSLKLLPVVMILSFLLSACATKRADTGADKPHYIYLPPETGSRISRRVLVNPDGAVVENASPVQRVSPESFGEFQRRGSVNRPTGQ